MVAKTQLSGLSLMAKVKRMQPVSEEQCMLSRKQDFLEWWSHRDRR
jgi:hypothetical protein